MSEGLQHTLKRRTFLQGSLALGGMAALTGLSACDGFTDGFFRRNNLPLGVQLHTVGQQAAQNIQLTLERLAYIGYEVVELSGFHGHTPAVLRAAANQQNLRFTSIHLQARGDGHSPGFDESPGRLAEDLHQLGVDYAVLPMFPTPAHISGRGQNESTLDFMVRMAESITFDDWVAFADFLNETGEALRHEGILFAYHNHNLEFAPLVDGSTGMEILISHTDPALVDFELDAGWTAAAGYDPRRYIRRFPDRFRLMHVKDIQAITATNFAMQQDPTQVGDGMIDWKSLLPAAYEAGVRHFYVEQEPPFAMDPFDALTRSHHYLRSL